MQGHAHRTIVINFPFDPSLLASNTDIEAPGTRFPDSRTCNEDNTRVDVPVIMDVKTDSSLGKIGSIRCGDRAWEPSGLKLS